MHSKHWAKQAVEAMVTQARNVAKQVDSDQVQERARFGQFLRLLIELIPAHELLIPEYVPVQFEDDFGNPALTMLRPDTEYVFCKQVEKLSEWSGFKIAKVWSIIAEQKSEVPTYLEMRHLLQQFTDKSEQVEILAYYFDSRSAKRYYAGTAGLDIRGDDAGGRPRKKTKERRAAALASLKQNPIRPHGGYRVSSGSGDRKPKPRQSAKPPTNERIFGTSVYIGQSDLEDLAEVREFQQQNSSWSDGD